MRVRGGGIADGTYQSVCHGFYGDFDISVTVEGGTITAIETADAKESPNVGGKAIGILIEDIIGNNTVGVDSVSGATVTSAVFKAAVTDCLKQAGAPQEMFDPPVPGGYADYTEDTDVLVIGTGVAGFAAAIAAAEAGAKVTMIEKQGIIGGSSTTSAGIVYSSMGEDDVETMVNYYMDRAEGKANRELLTYYAEHSPETIAWLEALGVQWQMVVPAGTAPEPRAHFSMDETGRSFTGAILVDKMEARASELGVEILLNTKATKLLTDDAAAVVGAEAEGKTGRYTFNAKAVVLATGGFDASEELKAQYSPIAVGDFPLSSKGNVGDGILMGIEIGADTCFNGGVIGFDFINGSLPESGMNAIAMYCNSYVQPDGTFVSDVIDYPITYTAIKTLGVDHFYGLYDAAGADSAEAAIALGWGWKGDTVEELAEATGMDAAKLADAIEQGTGLENAPFYAVWVAPTTIGSMGGLVINTDAQVLREGQPIPGLFASGEVANGEFYYQEYPASGSSLCLGMTFGLTAGRNAAEAAK